MKQSVMLAQLNEPVEYPRGLLVGTTTGRWPSSVLLHQTHHLYSMEQLRAALDKWDQR